MAVIAAVIAGLFLIGTPGEERARRLDEARLRELQQLRTAIDVHVIREGALPESLADLVRRSPLEVRTTEVGGGESFGYERIDSTGYRLCATFQFASSKDEGRYTEGSWRHGAGRQCFRFRARRRAPEDLPRPEDGAGPILERVRDSTP